MATIDILGTHHTYELTEAVPSAPVLVFVHGWLLSRHYWRPLVEHLSPAYQCLIYDLRGFGESPLGSGGDGTGRDRYTLQAYAEDLGHLLTALGLENVWLVGHSLGGSIALWSADRLPRQVNGVICLNSGGGIYLREEFDRFRAAGQQIIRFRTPWLQYLPGMVWIFSRIFVAEPIDPAWGQQRLVDFVTADREAALGTLLESTTEHEVYRLPKLVSALKQPVYFITGDKDQVMEPRYVRHLASFHSLFRSDCDNVIELPNCGHLSMIEQTDPVAHQIRYILGRYV